MQKVNIETSIVSFLRQRQSNHVITAAHQLITNLWWNDHRHKFELVTSEFVLEEAARGDPALAADRLSALQGIRLLELPLEIPNIATHILNRAILPAHATMDALHIATAAFHQVEYLMTWNCKHIANAQIIPKIVKLMDDLQMSCPTICTPEELLGDTNER